LDLPAQISTLPRCQAPERQNHHGLCHPRQSGAKPLFTPGLIRFLPPPIANWVQTPPGANARLLQKPD